MSIPHRWLTPPDYGDGDSAWGGQNDYAIYGQGRVPIREMFVNHYNARFFGARGDGVTDDRIALQIALNTIRLAGGGTLYLPAGTYFINSTQQHPVTPSQAVGLIVGNNTRIVGDGPGATVIRYGAMPNQTWLMSNYQTVFPYVDQNISLEGFTLDGNASGQTGSVDAHAGIYLIGVAHATHDNVEVRHVFGTTAGANGPNGTAGEGMAYKLSGCDHVAYLRCRAWSDRTASTSTGFSANKSNDVMYANCWSYGWKNSMGFTHWTCWSVRHTNCWSTNNGVDGFHSEVTDGACYDNCHAGGVTTAAQTALYASTTTLSNGQMGFHLFQCARALLVNCIARNNTSHGFYADSATGGVGSLQLISGSFGANGGYGIRLNDAATVSAAEVKSRPETSGNTTGEMFANGVAIGLRNVVTSPGVPATGTAFTNNYGVDMEVVIVPNGATVTAIALDGVTVATSSATSGTTVIVRNQGTITLTYSVATPAWKWQCAG